jgi:hypothetical protein
MTKTEEKSVSQIKKDYEAKFKRVQKEKDDNRQEIITLKSKIKGLEADNEKISKQMASSMPGQERRVCVQNLGQRLINTGLQKKVIVAIFESVHGKGPAESFKKSLDQSNYKPVEHPRVKADREEQEKEREDALKAAKEKPIEK